MIFKPVVLKIACVCEQNVYSVNNDGLKYKCWKKEDKYILNYIAFFIIISN